MGRLVGVGVGVDLVHIPSFADQLAQEGTTFTRVFTDREWARAVSREASTPGLAQPLPPNSPGHRLRSPGTTRSAASLAARWAAKEAAIKAWSSLIFAAAPVIPEEEIDWAEIEVVHDRWDRPALRFHGRVDAELTALAARLDAHLLWSLSLSHDGDNAIAYVQVHALAGTGPALVNPN